MELQGHFDLKTDEKRYVKGSILHIIYQNNDTFYSVLKVSTKESNLDRIEKEMIMVGTFPVLMEEETYIFWGDVKDHPKYGRQFVVEFYRKNLPRTEDGMVQYLSSDLFHGIGKKTAEKVIRTLGEDAFSKIIEDPEVLNKVKDLSEERARTIHETLMEHQGLEQLLSTLHRYGIGPAIAMKIYQSYKEEAISVIQSNPYQLIYDIDGIGFRRADELGNALGIEKTSSERVQAGLLYNLKELCNQHGHTYIEVEELIEETKKLLFNNPRDIEMDFYSEIVSLHSDGKVIIKDENAYLPPLYFAEYGLIQKLERLLKQDEYDRIELSDFYNALGVLEENQGIEYAEAQKDAIYKALISPMMILTGGPGTGKTTVIKGIIETYAEIHGLSLDIQQYKDDEFPFLLVAPTGRAAKRMSESTGLPAVTIHRLLGWKGGSGFEHHEENPIAGRLLIIDEMSMVDVRLAYRLFDALPDEIQVIIVGDEDQLPSVSPGQVLKDFINSKVIPTVRLDEIYRQAKGSTIVQLAHEMKKGTLPEDLRDPQYDRRFFPCSHDQVTKAVLQVCKSAMTKGYTAKDVQVLAPMYRGRAGIDELNKELQAMFNPPHEQKKEIEYFQSVYRVGDKVLQLVNVPEEQIFNGDIGEIVSIIYSKETADKEDQIVISFEGIEVTFKKTDLIQITHAYCCSIHKSQGSEFPIVVLPIVKAYYRMLRRNLIYTAVTRSKEYLILCGEMDALERAVQQNDSGNRNSHLSKKIRETVETSLINGSKSSSV
ncbi:SF1B family DNA helicase RecD2 [Pseudalkalibacillus salsuginis]|uniref:SF1B family DNA helicase RecD2 n=1 Tax=Pseudalkalibacillus salsuginis TaxID=2910972 RepID=UPI001F2F1C61|nr:ATP-dependent RecD-like DNA helicase [Pseudalkalibacillus salsuginis]MCF6408615.1 ATP-dependent RecD-like DNA helicase [Pseudalkalibacillus salsuginis]